MRWGTSRRSNRTPFQKNLPTSSLPGHHPGRAARRRFRSRIPELVQNYIRRVAAITEDVCAVSISPQRASPTAFFEIQIANTDILENKKKWEAFTYYPNGSNVDPNSFTIQPKGTKVMASGKLIDKNQKGFVLVHFIESR